VLFVAGCAKASGAAVDIDLYRARLHAIRTHDFFQTTRILDRHGKLLAEVAPKGYRTWVPLAEVPRALQQAVIATEDRTFYKNAGIDRKAFARALVQNTQAGTTVSGASTITMQLVRLVAFDPDERYERSIDRKLREIHLAAEIDEVYSKAEIMEAYLNVAYFGHGAYGVETAAQRYFGHRAKEMSLAESTLLAGLLQAPVALDPFLNPQGARARQRVVLDRMVQVGALSRIEAELVWMTPVKVTEPSPPPPRYGGHFVDYVIQQALPRAIGAHLAARGGFTVTTTIDLALNDRLRGLAAAHLARLRPRYNVTDASLVVLSPPTGEILAMVGGVDYDDPQSGQVNMAVHPRQPGSAFKPIAYAAALEAGWTPDSILRDTPRPFPIGNGATYQATNFDGKYRGSVPLRLALGNSLNAAAIDLTASVGLERVHTLAVDMGVRLDPDPWHYGLSLALGGAELPLLDLTSAYGAFAAGGQLVPPAAILKVESTDGEGTIYSHDAVAKSVVSAETAWTISDILSDAKARQPVFPAGPPMQVSRTAAVKTGTTNDVRDTLTIGYTPYVVVGVWTGNKNGQPMGDIGSSESAAPIWNAAMEAVFADGPTMTFLGGGRAPVDGFVRPAGMVDRGAGQPSRGGSANRGAGEPTGEGGLMAPGAGGWPNGDGPGGPADEGGWPEGAWPPDGGWPGDRGWPPDGAREGWPNGAGTGGWPNDGGANQG